ncbi:MAG: efflux RND transporter periplasmic adaptor subunit [Verrucomicrobia bacterium]|nr:efflux RND transporter periplasmic adaptor subunit [Verrucomicrobiota bacterium]
MKWNKVIFPLVFIGLGIAVAALLIRFKEKPQPVQPEIRPVSVEALELAPTNHRFIVESHGTIQPQREISLVVEVTGTIRYINQALEPGLTFKKGDTLIEIDQTDYQLALTRAQASLKQAEANLALERAQAEIARREWDSLGTGRESNALVLREPQLAESEARYQAAAADVELARLNLSRCTILAPFDGAVRSKLADLGQYVRVGSQIATIYGTDVYEVRLPVRVSDLRYLPIQVGVVPGAEALGQVDVRLDGEIGNESFRWIANVVQLETGLNELTRMATLVARISNPLRQDRMAPIPAGLFVKAYIAGLSATNVLQVPRAAVRNLENHQSLVVLDKDSRLQFRPVKPVQSLSDTLIIENSLDDGDKVVTSTLGLILPGQKALITGADKPADGSL